MAVESVSMNRSERFDLAALLHERIATRCVCCGTDSLESSPAILMPFVADRVFGWKPVVVDESWGLKTIAPGHAYSICKTMQCNVCGHLFCDIRFSDAEMANLYDGYREEEYTTLREYYEPGYKERNDALKLPLSYKREIEDFLSPLLEFPLTILDWGGDTGTNTPFRDKCAGIDIYDISNKEVETGTRSVTLDQVKSRSYGLLICSMVLEHTPFPFDVLMQIKSAMNDQSVLYVEVPYEKVMRDEQSVPLMSKKHWHEHINFYSEKSLKKLIENSGLTILSQNILFISTAGADCIFQVACKLASD